MYVAVLLKLIIVGVGKIRLEATICFSKYHLFWKQTANNIWILFVKRIFQIALT